MIAKLFMTGGSQAVRLPREFRFAGQSVTIRREGDSVILEPLKKDWSPAFWACLGQASDDLERPAAKKQRRRKAFR